MRAMARPTLYLFIGYPGAGKTTVAKAIAEATGAHHLWADRERLKLFTKPTHSEDESLELYKQMNNAAEYLLAQDKSVIFDTNFNHRKDRNHLREIALRHEAEAVIIWVTTPKSLAKQRAVHDNNLRNGYEMVMTDQEFEAIAAKLEPPTKDEKVIKIDGTKLDTEQLKQLLSL